MIKLKTFPEHKTSVFLVVLLSLNNYVENKWNRKKCRLSAFLPFPTMFSKAYFFCHWISALFGNGLRLCLHSICRSYLFLCNLKLIIIKVFCWCMYNCKDVYCFSDTCTSFYMCFALPHSKLFVLLQSIYRWQIKFGWNDLTCLKLGRKHYEQRENAGNWHFLIFPRCLWELLFLGLLKVISSVVNG